MSNARMSREMALQVLRRSAITELVQIITPLVKSPNDSLRQARDKVRQRILYALDKDDPQASAAIGEHDGFVPDLEKAAIWARSKWPSISFGAVHLVLPPISEAARLSDASIPWVIPGDKEQCQAALELAHKVLRSMREELKLVRKENARLSPLAKRYEEICQANRKSAAFPRKS